MSLYSRLDRLAADVAKLDRKVDSVSNAPQAQRTSIEAGTMDVNDEDGNLVSTIGLQEDGSGATRFFDGPVPPVPAGFTALADGPVIQGTWDGSFVDGLQATYDLAYLEVAATLVEDSGRVSFATITAKEGASATLVANQSGQWAVAVRSVSQAGKKSEFASAGTVEVKLVDLAGAIEAAQDSANGKNKVTYSEHAPTPDDPGIFDDTWFVGQVGRPNDVVEATNLAINSSLLTSQRLEGESTLISATQGSVSIDSTWASSGSTSAKHTTRGVNSWLWIHGKTGYTVHPDAGKTFTISADVRLAAPQTGDQNIYARSLAIRVDDASNVTDLGFAISNQAPNTAGVHRVKVTFTLPAGIRGWAIRAVAGAAGSSVWWDSFVIEEGTTASPYFDGDTEDGATDNESHYRWTGTPHASTSEKYLPALDIGASDNWNIIEQYRHDGTGWVKVELSHYVFSTVDLGKATVGELDGIRIMARTITGDLFSGDAFDGIVFRGNTFVTRDGNGEFSDRGLFFQKPDGTAIFRVPTDGTPISMSAADVQIQRAQIDELELNEGRVRSGGLFELSSGVTPPASPPELNSGWRKLATLPEPAERSNYDNLAYWANQDKWVRAVNVLGGGEGDRVEIYASSTGELTDSFAITIDPRHGVTVIGDTVYIFGKDHDIADPRVFIFGYDLNTGARTSRHEYSRAIQAKNALGNDGTNLIIGSVYNLELWVHRRNPATNAQVGSDMRSGSNSWPESGGKDLYGVNINGTEVEVVTSWGGRIYTNNSNVLTRKTDSSNASGFAGWVLPDHNTAGCAWIDGVPYPMNASGVVYEGSAFVSDSTVQACFTWYSGSYETTPSSTVTVGVDSRETVTISTPTRQGLQKRVYYRAGTSGTWNRANLGASETAFTVAGVILGLYQPPAGNTFPNADPAAFRSTNGNVVVRGDGSGKWGPLTFNADGTMSSSQVPEWVPITTFLNSWTASSTGFAPAYRVWPDGKVEWRGKFARSAAVTAGSVMFNLPTAVRPAQDVSVSVPINATNGSTTQPSSASFDFRAGSTNNAAVFPGISAVTSVSLDSIFYYLT